MSKSKTEEAIERLERKVDAFMSMVAPIAERVGENMLTSLGATRPLMGTSYTPIFEQRCEAPVPANTLDQLGCRIDSTLQYIEEVSMRVTHIEKLLNIIP